MVRRLSERHDAVEDQIVEPRGNRLLITRASSVELPHAWATVDRTNARTSAIQTRRACGGSRLRRQTSENGRPPRVAVAFVRLSLSCTDARLRYEHEHGVG